jgi:hypothetical protein
LERHKGFISDTRRQSYLNNFTKNLTLQRKRPCRTGAPIHARMLILLPDMILITFAPHRMGLIFPVHILTDQFITQRGGTYRKIMMEFGAKRE